MFAHDHHCPVLNYIWAEIITAGSAVGAFFHLLPSILAPFAVVLGIAWYTVNLFDWVEHRIAKHRHAIEKASAAMAKAGEAILQASADMHEASKTLQQPTSVVGNLVDKLRRSPPPEQGSYTVLDDEPPEDLTDDHPHHVPSAGPLDCSPKS